MTKIAWYLMWLTVVLTIFKLIGALQWSWLIVVSPIMIPILLIGVMVYGFAITSYVETSNWPYRLTYDPTDKDDL